MTKTNVLVTSATGNIGYQTLKALYECGTHRRFKVAACAYKAELETEVTPELRGLKELGCEIFPIDYDDMSSLENAFHHAQKLFLIPSTSDEKLEHTRNCIQAAKRAGVPFVLLLSVIEADKRKDLFGREFLKFEKELIASGLNYCFLRVGFYYENLLLFRRSIAKEGILPMSLGDGLFAPLDHSDVGLAAATILDKSDDYRGKTINLTGPEQLNGSAIAGKMSKFLGKTIQYQNVDSECMKEFLKKDCKMSEHEAEGIKEMCQLIADQRMKLELPALKEITATEAKFLEAFLIENKERLLTASEE